MLDVHPPHAATHSWKDFWIHLGTITAGLLIAISLEQSVEAIHHRHQRHALERDLLAEATHNRDILQQNLHVLKAEKTVDLNLLDQMDQLRPGTPLPPLPPPPPHSEDNMFLPSAGAWTSARDSTELSLLSRDTASVYEELFEQHEFLNRTIFDLFNAENDLEAFRSRYQPRTDKAHFDPTRLTPTQQEQYVSLLTRASEEVSTISGYMTFYLTEDDAVIHGADSAEALHEAVMRSYSTPAEPTTPTIK